MATKTAGTKLKLLGCFLVMTAACYETASRAATDPKGAPPQADEIKPNSAKPETVKPDASRSENGKPENGKSENTKSENGKPAAGKPEAQKQSNAKPEAVKPDVAKVDAAPVTDDPMSPETHANVRKYCVNIAAAATDARFAWQSKKLQELEARVKARVAELDAKQAELKAWLDRRDAVAKEARESLVNIYAKMKPENAAAQITALDDEMATAVLAALSPGKASAIFNEITDSGRAAKLASMLATPSALQSDKKL